MNAKLSEVADQLRQARRPEDVFGKLSGTPAQQISQARKIYHRLFRCVAPDLNPHVKEAQAASVMVNQLWQQAQASISAGTYGATPVTPKVTISTKLHAYAVEDVFASGDIANLYHGRIVSGEPVVLKVARAPADNDLMKIEADTLRYLLAPDRPEGQSFVRYLPQHIENFAFPTGSVVQQANAFKMPEGLYSLEEVMTAYPAGIDPRDMAWIWRRALMILGYVHARGVVHGAVLPSHLLIQPQEHHLVLIDWCYSVNLSANPDARIKAISTPYERWYPAEVGKRTTPYPATDILMAARCMIQLLGGDPISGKMPGKIPARLQGFLLSCLLPAPHQRPQDAWQLLDEFTELIERLWGRRTFRPFIMPTR